MKPGNQMEGLEDKEQLTNNIQSNIKKCSPDTGTTEND